MSVVDCILGVLYFQLRQFKKRLLETNHFSVCDFKRGAKVVPVTQVNIHPHISYAYGMGTCHREFTGSKSTCILFRVFSSQGLVSRKSRKPIRKTSTRLFCKAGLFICL